MKTDNLIKEAIRIPLDLVIDILEIIVKEELKHEVINVLSNRSILVVEISFDRSEIRKQKAVNVIQGLLAEYTEYRTWEHEDVNWRED